MIDEHARRREGFDPGITVEMADGQPWSLPMPSLEDADAELQATLHAVFESEDRAERLRSELALTILLLARNYDLAAEDYQLLLSFAPDDPALSRLQQAVHAMVEKAANVSRSQLPSIPETRLQASRRWLLSRMSGRPERHPFGWLLRPK
jgi:hypothetical protein